MQHAFKVADSNQISGIFASSVQLHISLSKQTKPFTILYSTKKVPLHHLACNQIHTRFLSFHGYCSLMQSIASLQPSPAESLGSHTMFFHRLVCCAWEDWVLLKIN